MKFWKLASAVIALIVSSTANAAIITHGNLVTDDATNYITDTITGRQYLRFDTFNLSVTDTIAATTAGGVYEDWAIATADIADDFIEATLNLSTTPCTGVTAWTSCGTLSGWTYGDFGESYSPGLDHFWYSIPDNTGAYRVGLGRIDGNGNFVDFYNWGSASDVDYHGISDPNLPINALLYREVSAVPVPAAVWLFGSGLIGLVGMARRKKA